MQLLGDLLFRIVGSSGRMQLDMADDSEGVGTETQANMVVIVLGMERRNSVLASLVRQGSVAFSCTMSV